MEPAIELRPPQGDEDGLAFELFFQARRDDFAALGWTEPQLRSFLASQHGMQQAHYRAQYPGSVVRTIVVDGRAAGRVRTDWGPEALCLVDIALLPEFRSKGAGSQVLRLLIAEAESRGLPMELHVEAVNPARRLYGRLGFQERGGDGVYLHLVRPAGSGASEPDGN